MNFTISRENFLQPLQLVSGAVERRHTLPILSNVLIKVSEGALWLTGTDLEVELISSVKLEGDFAEGEITVPAKKLFDICRGLSEGTEINFSLDGNKALIRAGRGRYTLSTLSASDYPNLEDWEGELEFEVSGANLKRLIDSVQFSMAQQDVRYYLNGMSLETEEHLVRTVATDGHRLALCRMEYTEATLSARQVIIPRKGVLEISRLIEDDDKLLKIQIGANHIRLFSSEFIFTSKLVDGRFPDYRRVLPKDGDKVIIAKKDVLKDAFSRAAILSNEKFRGVRLNISSGELKITANNPEQEEAEEIVDIDYEGDSLEIGFNVAYLIDVLNSLVSNDVKINLTDANSSALIEDAADDAALYVIMPMRL
ncbi:MAG: DNA polymerase III subunit beta [Pseudomonadota bacterium]|jgi:DNA polymerase-3 subunit beta|uniref:DNA polymerase III subunit beta n=1 Tax=Marisediminitalea TaxID=2662254 RepID=UPI0020CF5D88|nr:DNA polymerase III subunit beta [Marisediminitalea aggregata]MCP3863613.1 DNA polymerase III subunit beta [Aestuariibacter sp.]MEC7824140.1 DNA polymerase III subunit beta [Pseudomonadota bacterium]MCP4524627.1 DNA polymerase III subunit beta [Aestuariibacter sp.]MCP4948586.1 DNA polymerase III subunit beta [Aestuariibacter sp.]MCP9476678.1 DNA polymerase III subunit beta [Marisediminitalea aggregata]|tara:strand:+ start:4828 stop:5931 length:1104 start_codon:yes stop_codon:yes gene_type:complete